MKLIYLLILHLLLLDTGCKSNSSQRPERAASGSGNGVEILQDTLTQVANGQLIFSNGTFKVLPFTNDMATTVLILVRHAEQEANGEDPEDPELTSVGRTRAERLADILQNFPLDGIYTNFFARTTKTAQPSAYQQEQPIQFYDHEKAADFVIQLAARQIGKNILIVGGANSVVQMLNRLHGESRFPDINATDYNNIYLVSINKDGQAVNIIRAIY